MVNLTKEYLERHWSNNCTRDVYEDVSGLVMNINTTTLFGGYKGTHTFDEVGKAITITFEIFARRGTSILSVPEWLPTLDNLKFNDAIKKLDHILYEVIKERRKLIAQESHGPTKRDMSGGFRDLLAHLIEAVDDRCSGMTDVYLRDELMTFLIAGQETSSTLLAWCLHVLALHPQLQEKAYMEIKSVIGNKEPSHEDIQKLHLTEAIILETMRLMPPAYIVGRCADHPTSLGNWHIPKGTTLFVGIYLLHRDPLYWRDPLQFDPARWLQDHRGNKLTENEAYWPFGGGPRSCIGMRFAMMEACLVLSVILLHYKVSLSKRGSSETKLKANITLLPPHKLDLDLVRRQ